MEQPIEFSEHGVRPGMSRLQSLLLMAVVGVSITLAGLAMLGSFTRIQPTESSHALALVDPFAEHSEGAVGNLDAETCQVMSTAIKDINNRMGEGVTEKQARYFRTRRDKLYNMMRERCGV